MNVPRPLLAGTTLFTMFFLLAALSGSHYNRAQAQSPSDQAGSIELDTFLFVQDPQFKNGRAAIDLIWLPEPLARVCLGKTETQCAEIDFCVRTTNPDSARCRKIGIPRARLPHYPPDMRPRRQLSTTFFYPMSPTNGRDRLQSFFKAAPRGSLVRLSMSARVKARIRYTRKPDDDDFYVLSILAVPPF